MVKTLHSAGGGSATTLVILGWLSFVLSNVVKNSFFVFVLRAAARVLPKSFMHSLICSSCAFAERQAVQIGFSLATA